MAKLTGATVHTDAVGVREDLEDVIHLLDPMDTWALSNLDRVQVSQIYHEWQADLLDPATVNTVVEGDEATYAAIAQPLRIGNYCAITRKTFRVSGTLEQTTLAGRSSEMNRRRKKAMQEWKRDVEKMIVGNYGAEAGASGTARASSSMEAFIMSIDNTKTINGVATTGTGSRTTTTSASSSKGFTTGGAPVATDSSSTLAALTEAGMISTLGLAWANGGDPRVILANSVNKNKIGTFTGVATKYNEVKGKQAAVTIGSVDYYVSDFGNHAVILSRYARTATLLMLDPDYWAVGFLRNPSLVKLAITGDAVNEMIIGEWTLVCRNPWASAKMMAISGA